MTPASGRYWGHMSDCAYCRGRGALEQGSRRTRPNLSEMTDLVELTAALRAFPELKVAAGEVLYQSIPTRAQVALLRRAALELRGVLVERLASGE